MKPKSDKQPSPQAVPATLDTSPVMTRTRGRRPVTVVKQPEFFEANFLNPNFKDERQLLETPLFALDKEGKSTDIIKFDLRGASIVVSRNAEYGMATIWDWDFMLWAASQINEAARRGEAPTRVLHVQPYHFLTQTGRGTGKKAYQLFEAALDRLKSTSIKTNIPAGGQIFTNHFSWIDSWQAIKDSKGRVRFLEVTLCEWFFRRVAGDKTILSISKEYFSLTGGIERWLYRIARRSNGGQHRLKAIYDRYPSGRAYKSFKYDIKRICERDPLPEFHVRLYTEDNEDWIEFEPRDG